MEFKDIKWPETLFITGIGKNAGKSYATGWLAREMTAAEQYVITLKAVQTGSSEIADDIRIHRKIMNQPVVTFDMTRITSPCKFETVAAPHIAAKLENSEIKAELITEATRLLHKNYKHVLIEGSEGLMTPLKGDYLTINYIKDNKLPTILVINGAPGSISDSLMTLYAMAHYKIDIFGVIYNPHFDKDKTVAAETREYLKEWVLHHYPGTLWFEMPETL